MTWLKIEAINTSAIAPTRAGTRRSLRQLTDLLAGAAADGASNARLTDDERNQLIRQGAIFSSSVAELIKILEDHQHEHVREHRLYKLFEAVGSACFIGHCQLIDPTRNRLKTTDATDAKKASSQKTDDIIVQEAKATWRRHPNHTPWRVAGEIGERVNQRLGSEGLEKLGRHAIAHRLKRLRPSILTAS